MILSDLQQILLFVFLLINLYTFIVVAYDKRKAIKSQGHRRTPEGYMFFLGSMFGALGVFFAMYLFRHKTRKWYFQVGIPLLIVQNAATVYVLSLLL